jgi:hypothetical protein
MRNFSRLDITTDRGIINRGKYTFPKIEAFDMKVEEVCTKHDEK